MNITSGTPEINLGGCGDGFGSNTGLILLAFLAMMGGGNGFFGGNRVPNNVATTDTVNQSVQFSQLQDQNAAIINSIGQSRSDLGQYIGDRYNELQRDIAANAVTLAELKASQSECCCQLKQEILQQTINTNNQFAALKQDMAQQEIQNLRDKVANLQADMRMQGVVRYPNGFVYNAGCSPFCGCNNGVVATC